MNTLRRTSALATALVLTLSSTRLLAVGPADAATAPAGASYAQAQAERGHQSFNNRCAQCHRPDLSGALGPALNGPAFLTKWGAGSVAELMRFEHDNMPANAPGTLSDADVADITAYILSRNGIAAGPSALTADSAVSMHLLAAAKR